MLAFRLPVPPFLSCQNVDKMLWQPSEIKTEKPKASETFPRPETPAYPETLETARQHNLPSATQTLKSVRKMKSGGAGRVGIESTNNQQPTTNNHLEVIAECVFDYRDELPPILCCQ